MSEIQVGSPHPIGVQNPKKNVVVLFYPSPWPNGFRGRIPYALLYLERMIRDFPIEVLLVDERLHPDPIKMLEPVKDRILLVGVSSMTGFQLQGALKFSKQVKELCGAPIAWGGWHPSLLPEQVLAEPFVDFVFLGQAETSFREFVECLLEGKDYTGIAGFGYKVGTELKVSTQRPIQNVKIFPKLNLKLIDLKPFIIKTAYAERSLSYFASHGCPFDCAFCCVAKVFKHRWYSQTTQQVIEDLKYMKETAGIDSLTFDDDNFFVNRKATIELCQAMIDEKLDLKWDTSAHAGHFLKKYSKEDLQLIYQAGCRQIYIGAESGDSDALDLISKQATVDDNYQFVIMLRDAGIIPLFSTMIGLPMDPEKDMRMTLDMIRKGKLIDPDLRARAFFYTPYPGTQLYDLALEKGLKPPTTLEGWSNWTLRKFKPPWLKKDVRWTMEVFMNFYFPLASPKTYLLVPGALKWVVFVINKLFYPIAHFRFRYNFFTAPIEAILFLLSLRAFNKVMGTEYNLGYESYFGGKF